MKKTFTTFLIIYTLFLCACPKETAIRKASKASFQLSGLTIDAVNATAKAFDAGIIDLSTKDKLADSLKLIAIGGKRFNNTLEIFVRESGENLPTTKIEILNRIFSEEIVTPFLEILQKVKIISAAKAEYLVIAINSLRAAILLISDGFTAANAKVEVRYGNYA